MDEESVRAIVREEIASLSGKMLRRTQDRSYTRSPDRNLALDIANEEMARMWGEVLAEYSNEWPVPKDPVPVPPDAGS